MRVLKAQDITETVAQLCMEAEYPLGADMLAAFDRAAAVERSPAGCDVRPCVALSKENAHLARIWHSPY